FSSQAWRCRDWPWGHGKMCRCPSTPKWVALRYRVDDNPNIGCLSRLLATCALQSPSHSCDRGVFGWLNDGQSQPAHFGRPENPVSADCGTTSHCHGIERWG